ncbi:MAG: hypothetical protein KatS3mg071_0770 [Meiothermus sp.]|nr:MAG: hypothetical protein KatS3mg071_0770 [Meiothermus sp.]
MSNRYIGQPMKRQEDGKLVRGQGRYLADLPSENLLHLALVRSPYAHARLVSVDTTEARKLPGVVGVYTSSDLPELYAPASVPRDAQGALHPLLGPRAGALRGGAGGGGAGDLRGPGPRRRPAGVWVEYEPLPAYADVRAGRGRLPAIHPQLPSNVALARKTTCGRGGPGLCPGSRGGGRPAWCSSGWPPAPWSPGGFWPAGTASARPSRSGRAPRCPTTCAARWPNGWAWPRTRYG